MKLIELKNPLLLISIGKFVTVAAQMEQYIEMMAEVTPPEKKALVEELNQHLQAMLPIINKIKEGELPAELKALLEEANKDGKPIELVDGTSLIAPEKPKTQEEVIEDLLEKITKNYK